MKNPIRRNKKIGLTQGGRVKDGRAEEKLSKLFPQNIWKTISDDKQTWKIFVENPSKDYYHPCEPSEYIDILKKLPPHHTEDIKGIKLNEKSMLNPLLEL